MSDAYVASAHTAEVYLSPYGENKVALAYAAVAQAKALERIADALEKIAGKEELS